MVSSLLYVACLAAPIHIILPRVGPLLTLKMLEALLFSQLWDAPGENCHPTHTRTHTRAHTYTHLQSVGRRANLALVTRAHFAPMVLNLSGIYQAWLAD